MKFISSLILIFGLVLGIQAAELPYVGDGRVAPKETTVTLPTIDPINYDTISFTPIDVTSIDQPETVTVDTVTVEDFTKGFDEQFAKHAEFRKLVKDQRNVSHHKDLMGLGDNSIDKWIAIYKNTYEPIEKIELPKGVKMIAEMQMPQNETEANTLYGNLIYRKAQGFNAVLLVFHGNEQTYDLVDLVNAVKTKLDMKVWFAFGGMESLLDSQVFINPDKYSDLLIKVASVCDGFLANYRRTSSHLFIQDDAFMRYTAEQVRIGNPLIPIVGEIYLGQTAASDDNSLNNTGKRRWNPGRHAHNWDTLIASKVENGSGYLLVNMTSFGYNPRGIMNSVLKDYTEPKYVLISGPTVYFLSLHKTTTTYEQDMKDIKYLMDRWTKAGAYGCVVMHGDGYGLNGYPSDNMSKTHYTKLK